jgi:hypothetical protein
LNGLALVTVTALCSPFPLFTQQHGPVAAAKPSLRLEEVLARMARQQEAHLAALQQYTSFRQYTLENTRFGAAAGLQVRMRYHYPGVKTFEVLSASGSSTLRSRVLDRMIKAELEASQSAVRAGTEVTPTNYRFHLTGMDEQKGRACYVLDATPIEPTRFLFRGKIWVDAEDFAIARIEGAPALNLSFWIRKTTFVHEYGKFGSHWLPVSNRSASEVKIFGRTLVNLAYTGYTINQPDSTARESRARTMVVLDAAGGDDWHPEPVKSPN